MILHNSSVTGELLNLPAALVQPGATHQDILRHFYRRGDFGTEVPEDDFIADRRARILAAGNLTYPARMPDGTWVEYNFRKLEDEHLLVTVRDITALKERELELEQERAEAAEQRDRLDTLLAHLQDFVVLFDEADRVLIAADIGALMGLPPERITPGQRLHDMLAELIARGDLGSPPANAMADAAARVARIRDKGGSRTVYRMAPGAWVEFTFRLVGGGRMLLIGRDVSETKQREAELERERDAAEAAGRAKIAFLAAMSHEIRTPMNGVLEILEVLGRSEMQTGQDRIVGVMRDSAQALLRILNDVLDFSKIEAGRMDFEHVPFSLDDLVRGTLETLVPEAQSGGARSAPGIPSRCGAGSAHPRPTRYAPRRSSGRGMLRARWQAMGHAVLATVRTGGRLNRRGVTRKGRAARQTRPNPPRRAIRPRQSGGRTSPKAAMAAIREEAWTMSININPFLDLDTNGRGSAAKADASRPVAVNLNPFVDVAGIGPWDIEPANQVVIGWRLG